MKNQKTFFVVLALTDLVPVGVDESVRVHSGGAIVVGTAAVIGGGRWAIRRPGVLAGRGRRGRRRSGERRQGVVR